MSRLRSRGCIGGEGEGAHLLMMDGVLVLPTGRHCAGPWAQSQDEAVGDLLPPKAPVYGKDAHSQDSYEGKDMWLDR